MVNIIICEDNNKEREKIENILNSIIDKQEYDFKIVLSTNNPYYVKNYSLNHTDSINAYFIDIDFHPNAAQFFGDELFFVLLIVLCY